LSGVVGTARLPRTLAGEQSAPLIIELAFDDASKTITGVASTIQLPLYQTLLRNLIGVQLAELEFVARGVFAGYSGPLLRPTLAALANALANAHESASPSWTAPQQPAANQSA
jgi:hypothetical protein